MSEDVGGEDFAWAQLVTDGHVRAARLRWMQPWLIGIGVACILLGFYIGSLTATVSTSIAMSAAGGSSSLIEQIDASRSRVGTAEQGLPGLRMTGDQVKALPAAAAIRTDVLPALQTAFAKGGLPIDIPTAAVTPEVFWKGQWPQEKVVVAGDDKVKITGALVAEGSEPYAVPKRWIGVFRNKGGQWDYATAEGEGFAEVSGRPRVDLTDIPLTLSAVLPPAAEAQ